MIDSDNNPNWPHWLNWLLAALGLIALAAARIQAIGRGIAGVWRWFVRRFNAMADLAASMAKIAKELEQSRLETNARFLSMAGTVDLVHNRAIIAHAQADMLLDDSTTAIYRCELPSGVCTYVNHALSNLFAMERAQLLSWGWTDRVHPDDRPRVLSEYLESVRTGKPYRSIYRRWLDGQSLTVEASGHTVNNDRGEPIALIGKVMPLPIHT